MRVTAPADRRFRRVLVKPGRRRRVWPARAARILRVAVPLAILAAMASYGARAAATAPTLRVDTIRVEGNEHLPRGEVLALLAGLRGEHILAADLEPWRRRVLGSPWVASASLRRVLPSTVEVAVSEREPMGIARLAGELYLVDETGTVIDAYGTQYARFDLPLIDGLSRTPSGEADPVRAQLAGRLLADVAARTDLASRISQIDVSDPRDAVVLLDEDPALVHLGDQAFRRRLELYLDLAEALRARVPAIDYVDMRFGDRVFVGPAGSRRGARGAR